MRSIRGPREQREVSPAIPYLAIGCPILSTDLDLSISAGLISNRTSAENQLDILASQAAEMFEKPMRRKHATHLT